jgi:heme/copper-type cytochrome/quinol oxidase subunit 3
VSITTTAVPASPPLPPAAVLGTVLVIACDVMLFAGLLFVFWVLRLAAPVWPPPLQPRLPLGLTAMNTLVLLASGAVITWTGPHARVVRRLAAAMVLGALFVAVQGYEWVRLVGFGLTVTSGTYGALFYTVIGAHALHVVVALAWLGATLVRAARIGSGGDRDATMEACVLYWRFVVALWPPLYVCVYLL